MRHRACCIGVVGEEVKQTDFSRAHRREYRRKVQLCLDVFETMLTQSSFEFERPLTGMEIECNLVDAGYQPAMSNSGSAGLDRRSGLPNRIGRLQHRIQRSAAAVARPGGTGAGGRGSGQPQRRRVEGQYERRAHRDDRHPADADARTPFRRLDERVDPLSGAQRFDLHRPRRGHPDRHRRPGTAQPADRVHRTRIRVHQHATAPAGLPRRLREELERRAGAGRPAAGAGRQLAVLLRASTVVGDPHRTVRPGHRHPARRAQGAGGAAAGLVRRTVDHVDLRPVRGERPLLPVAAARAVRRGPGRRAGRGAHAAAAGAAAAQRHDLPVEPAGVRRRRRPTAPAGGEPRAARRARPSST